MDLEAWDARGKIEIDLKADLSDMKKGRFEIDTFNATLSDLVYKDAKGSLRQDRFQIQGQEAVCNPMDRAIAMDQLIVSGSPGSLTVKEIAVPDWADSIGGIAGEITGRLSLTLLFDALRDYVGGPRPDVVSGTAHLVGAVRSHTDGGRAIRVQIEIPDFKMARGDSTGAWFEDKLECQLDARFDQEKGTFDLDDWMLTSTPLGLSAGGGLRAIDGRNTTCRGREAEL